MRSLQGLFIESEMLSTLEWESFWLTNDPYFMDSVVQLAISTKESFMRKDKVDSTINFEALCIQASNIKQQFEGWKKNVKKNLHGIVHCQGSYRLI